MNIAYQIDSVCNTKIYNYLIRYILIITNIDKYTIHYILYDASKMFYSSTKCNKF